MGNNVNGMANKNREALSIVLATDENYIIPTSVVIRSVIDNNYDRIRIDFWIFCSKLEEWAKDAADIFDVFRKEGYQVTLINDEHIVDLCRKDNLPAYKGSYGIYCKLFMAEFISVTHNILWLDSDVVVVDSLKELAGLTDACMYGCLDTANNKWWRKALLIDADYSIGIFSVCLINPDMWKKNNSLRKIEAWLNNFNRNGIEEILKYSLAEIAVMSGGLQGDWKMLDARYQVLPANYLLGTDNLYRLFALNSHLYYKDKDLRLAKENPCIIHYMHYIVPKPWFHDELNEFEAIWIKYYDRLGEYKNVFPIKRQYEMGKIEKIKRFLFMKCRCIYVWLGRIHVWNMAKKGKRIVRKYKL